MPPAERPIGNLRQRQNGNWQSQVMAKDKELHAQVDELLRRTRLFKGLPETVEDPETLKRVAAIILPSSFGG